MNLYYNTNNGWGQTSSWTIDSFGGSQSNSIPTSGDTVYFDSALGASTMTLDIIDAVCGPMFIGSGGICTFYTQGNPLRIAGAITVNNSWIIDNGSNPLSVLTINFGLLITPTVSIVTCVGAVKWVIDNGATPVTLWNVNNTLTDPCTMGIIEVAPTSTGIVEFIFNISINKYAFKLSSLKLNPGNNIRINDNNRSGKGGMDVDVIDWHGTNSNPITFYNYPTGGVRAGRWKINTSCTVSYCTIYKQNVSAGFAILAPTNLGNIDSGLNVNIDFTPILPPPPPSIKVFAHWKGH